MTSEIFKHFTRCEKAGFLLSTNPNLGNTQLNKRSVSKDEFYDLAYSFVVQEELIGNNKIFRNKEFKSGNESVAADIFIESEDGNTLIGLVFSTRNPDWLEVRKLAYNYSVISGSGVKIKRVLIISIRNNYEKLGNITQKILLVVDHINSIKHMQPRISADLKRYKLILRNNATPGNQIGHLCKEPTVCPFMNFCTQQVFPGSDSILELNEMSFNKKLQLFRSGIVDFKDLPPSTPLTATDRKQFVSSITKKNNIEKKNIEKWIEQNSLHGDIWFLNFETEFFVAPYYDGGKPFSIFPFLYSLIYLGEDNNNPSFFNYLIESKLNPSSVRDFINKFIQTLKIKNDAVIIVNNEKMVKACLMNMACLSPEFTTIIADIIKRIVDIRKVFKEKWFYDPRFKGSTYLKEITPIICPDISYDALKIKSGIEARNEFRNLIQENGQVSIEIKNHLMAYSQMDSLSLVKILEFLKNLTKPKATKSLN